MLHANSLGRNRSAMHRICEDVHGVPLDVQPIPTARGQRSIPRGSTTSEHRRDHTSSAWLLSSDAPSFCVGLMSKARHLLRTFSDADSRSRGSIRGLGTQAMRVRVVQEHVAAAAQSVASHPSMGIVARRSRKREEIRGINSITATTRGKLLMRGISPRGDQIADHVITFQTTYIATRLDRAPARG